MKFKIASLRNKVWLYFVGFSIAILAFLWFFQVLFLNVYYEWVKTKEIENIANKIAESHTSEDFEDILDSISFEQGICIEILNNNDKIYSSNTLNKGCFGEYSNDPNYLKYKRNILNSGEDKITYKLINSHRGNKIIMYGLKINQEYYVIVNASLEPLDSTIKILASQLIYVTIVVLIVSFLISYYISRYISKPIDNLTKTAAQMANREPNIKFETKSDIEELNTLANTLNKANEELSKTDELRRELMANVSHDLKTPLTMIKAYAEMVRDLTHNDKEKRNNNLNTIIDETDRLNLLVNDMLELSKMQSHVTELKLEKFDLNKLIETVIERFSYLEEKENYKFNYLGIDNAIVNADKIKIEQVIYNLISNATNYVGADKQVIVNLKIDDNYYKVEVIDHGKGISKNDLELIWDKYYRIDKNHKRNTIGTGLGLSIVKNIFVMHNFEYGVESKKNRGTTFYFKVKKEQ